MSIISASTTTTTAYQVTADTTGTLVLKTGASPTTAVTIDGSQNVTLTGNITLNNGTADGAQLVLQSSGFSDWNIDNYSGNFRWYYNTTEYMRLTNTGNLGLGVTPSAWYSSYKALQVKTSALAAWGNNEVYLMSNAYGDTSSTYKYLATGSKATSYVQYEGTHLWNTAGTGTAGNPITFTQAMTLDASGNLGVGTSSPNAKVDVSGSVNITSDNGLNGTWTGLATRYISGNNSAYLQAVALSGGTVTGGKDLSFDGSQLLFRTISGAAFSERARIDSSGNLLVGTTSQISADKVGIKYTGATNNGLTLSDTQASGDAVRFFANTTTQVGSISHTSTTTSYNTSSDYRLKENVQPMTGALARVAALKPVTYIWKADGSDGEGFIAHELQAVVPDCVTGEKDAVDEEGNPIYQGIDTSFLVATLTAAIQEQQAIIQQLTARIETLEAK